MPINANTADILSLNDLAADDYLVGIDDSANAVVRVPAVGLAQQASVFYVDSVNGSDAFDGTTWAKAKATLDAAVGLCTDSVGDVIIVAAGHAETLAAANAADLDKIGLTVVGRGNGSNKPTLTFGTSAAASLRINAVNVRLKNFRFVNNIDSLVKFVDVNADYATIEDCDFVTSSTKEATSFINIATTKDFTKIKRCELYQPTDPTGTDGNADTGGVFMVDSENVTIEDCKFVGNFETAIIHNRTTGAANLWLKNCFGIQNLSGAEPFQLVSTATGGAIGGGFITPAEIAVTEATLSGTLPAGFFTFGTRFGNDGGGGQNAVLLADAS